MTTYKIIMTPDATDDITELSRYIAKNLNAPRTALSYVRAIRAGNIKAVRDARCHQACGS